MTGAARNALRVKTPAVAQLVVLTSSATSSAPSDFRPTWTAAAVNPPGDVTEPSGMAVNAEGMAGQNSRPGSLVLPFAVSYHSATIPEGPVRCRIRSSVPTNTTNVR